MLGVVRARVDQKVAGAYSRHNFPPPELDQAFRATEAVYRTNKALVQVCLRPPGRSPFPMPDPARALCPQKLNEIGPNPASPKALGDLLMRWIGDLEPAYTRYATNYRTGFDLFQPVQTNPKLGPILDALSWPATLAAPLSSSTPVTLDVLFSLPAERLVYYSKLYARLLKSTQEGRSDHALLVAANERLTALLGIVDDSRRLSVLPEDQLRALAFEEQQRRGGPTGGRSSGEGSDSQGSRSVPSCRRVLGERGFTVPRRHKGGFGGPLTVSCAGHAAIGTRPRRLARRPARPSARPSRP